jgi:hypothetical protein
LAAAPATPHGNHSVRVPDELGHLTSPLGRWLRRTERLLLGASGRFRSVDDPDPYRSISAIHDDDFKDARQRVSAHSVTTCFAGHPATERFTPSAGFGGLASDRGVFSTPSPPSSVPLTLRRCAGSRWSASQRPPASARESFVPLGARGSRVEPVSLGHSFEPREVLERSGPRASFPISPVPARSTTGPGFLTESLGRCGGFCSVNRPFGTFACPVPPRSTRRPLQLRRRTFGRRWFVPSPVSKRQTSRPVSRRRRVSQQATPKGLPLEARPTPFVI